MAHFDLMFENDKTHSLLEPPTPAYTSLTVRRAFIVWLHLGQKNEFRQVCNYFHYLEAMEEKLTPEQRAASRHLEFNLLSNQPPISFFVDLHFPNLYRRSKHNKVDLKQVEEIKLEDCIFNFEGYHDLKIQKGIKTKEVIMASQMIRKYCKAHLKSLKKFLQEFHSFAKKTEVKPTVNNIFFYIQKKFLEDELVTFRNMPRHFNFLDADDHKIKAEVKDIKKSVLDKENNSNVTINVNKIRILINEARRKELINLLPQLSKLPLKVIENTTLVKENLISSEVIEAHNDNINDELEFVKQI